MASSRATSYSSDSSDNSDLPARGRTRHRTGAGRSDKTKGGRISKPSPKTKTVKIAEEPKGKDTKGKDTKGKGTKGKGTKGKGTKGKGTKGKGTKGKGTKGKARVIKGRTREDSPHPGHFAGLSSGSSSGSPSGSSSGSSSGSGDPPAEARVNHLELQLRLQQLQLTEHKRLLAEVDQKILDSACRCPDEDNGCKCNQDNAGGVDRAEIDEIQRRLNQTHVLAEDVADAIWTLHEDTMDALDDMHGRLGHTQDLAEETANAVRDLQENGTVEVEDMIQRIDELEGRLRVLETGSPSTPPGLPTTAPSERRPAICSGLRGRPRPGDGPENPIRSPIASDSRGRPRRGDGPENPIVCPIVLSPRGPSVPSSGTPPPIAPDFGLCGVGRLRRGDSPPPIALSPRGPSVPSSGTPPPIASGSHDTSVSEADPSMPGGPAVPDAGPARRTCPCEPCDCVRDTLPESPSNDQPPSINSSSDEANLSDGSTSGENSSSSEEDDPADMDYLD